jgi:arabinan endo-1,5-alpha-L-arabinosidase
MPTVVVSVVLSVLVAASLATASDSEPLRYTWTIYEASRHLPLDEFNRALDLLDDSDRRAVPNDFATTHPDDLTLALFGRAWSDQIAAAAMLVASADPNGGVVHLGEGTVHIDHGQYGMDPTYDDMLDAYWRARPDGAWPAVHDPSPAIRDGDFWYVFATAEGIPTFRSRDRLAWRLVGPAFPKGEQPAWWQDWQPANAVKDPTTGRLISGDFNPNVFVWAPHVVKHNGLFHLYYSIPASWGLHRTAAIGHATKHTLDPSVPWIDDGFPVITCTDDDPFNAIDPAFIVDRAGEAWMVFGSFAPGGINLVPLDTETGRLRDGATKPWTQIAGDGMESPAIHFEPSTDRYYLFASEGFGIGPPWDYKVRVWRTERGAPISGPYVDRAGRDAMTSMNQIGRGEKNDNPGEILIGPEGDRIAPGGQAVYRDEDGAVYVVFHERDNSLWHNPPGMKPFPAFNLQIRAIAFDAEGWPVVGPETLKTPDPTTQARPPVYPGEPAP